MKKIPAVRFDMENGFDLNRKLKNISISNDTTWKIITKLQ